MNLTKQQKEQCRELDKALNYGCQLYLDDEGDVYVEIGPIGLYCLANQFLYERSHLPDLRPIHPSLYREPVVQDVIRKCEELGRTNYDLRMGLKKIRYWSNGAKYEKSWKDFLEWPEQEIEKGAKVACWNGYNKESAIDFGIYRYSSGNEKTLPHRVRFSNKREFDYEFVVPYEWTEDELFNGVSEETAKEIKGEG